MQGFPYKAVVKQSWDAAKANYGMIMAFLAVFIGIHYTFHFLGKAVGDHSPARFPIFLVLHVIVIFFCIGLIRFLLGAVDGKKNPFSLLFSGFDVFLPFLAAQILYMIVCTLGMILLIVPGVILGYKYFFAAYFIADQNTGVKEAFCRSGQMTRGYKRHLFGLSWLFGLMNLAGAACLGIGLLVTIPWTLFFFPVTFRLLASGGVAGSGLVLPEGTGSGGKGGTA